MTHSTQSRFDRWASVARDANGSEVVTTDPEGKALDMEVGREIRSLESIRRDVDRRYKLACDVVSGTAKVLEAAKSQSADAERERAELAEQVALLDKKIEALKSGDPLLKDLVEALETAADALDNYSDTQDGADGTPRPNKAMSAATVVDAALRKAGR